MSLERFFIMNRNENGEGTELRFTESESLTHFSFIQGQRLMARFYSQMFSFRFSSFIENVVRGTYFLEVVQVDHVFLLTNALQNILQELKSL